MPRAGGAGPLGCEEEVTRTGVWLGVWVGDPAPVTAFDGLLHAHAGSLSHFLAVTLRLGSLLCDSKGCDGDRDGDRRLLCRGQRGRHELGRDREGTDGSCARTDQAETLTAQPRAG